MIKKSFNLSIFQSLNVNSRSGFTVLESIVAIMILSLSISGVFSVIQNNLSQSTIAKDEVKAFYLAQEAMEIIRNKRDNNQLAIINGLGGNWLDGIVGASDCPIGGICKVDAKAADKIQSCSGSCENLRQESGTFLYNHTTGNLTNFNREIRIESVNANEIAVTVRISWSKGSIPLEFKVKTHLFNWI